MYPKNSYTPSYTNSSKMNDILKFLSDYFGSISMTNCIQTCIMDYDIPIKIGRSKVMEMVHQAECIGVIKSIINTFDPLYNCVKCRDALKYLHVDYKQADPTLAILDYGKVIWSKQISRPQLLTCATGDIDEASCYLLARYIFTRNTIDGFCESCTNLNSSFHAFYQNVIKTYIARYYTSLSEKYSELDANSLPAELADEIDRIMRQWVLAFLNEYQ